MNYSTKIFSRIGELLQGVLPDQSHFLVSGIPSRHFFSEAVLQDNHSAKGMQLPQKASDALQLLLAAYAQGNEQPRACLDGRQLVDQYLHGKTILLDSNIPTGKGLSSSSTDILSVLYVANDYLQAGFSHYELYTMAASIEPTDPCLSNDIVLFKQQTGITDSIITLPPLVMMYFDSEPSRQINTVQLKREYPKHSTVFFASLLNRFIIAAGQKDYDSLFDCVTQSAVYNQSVISLPCFEEYCRLAAQSNSGVMVAHSGTIIGFVTRPDKWKVLLPEVEKLANRYWPTKVYVETYDPKLEI